MAKFIKTASITIPSLPKIYSNWGNPNVIGDNTTILKNVISKYGVLTEKYCDVLEIDYNVFISFICTESAGDRNAYNKGSGASGLTQVTSIAIREAFSRFKVTTGQSLPTEISTYINKVSPYLLKLTSNSQKLSSVNEAKMKSLMLSDVEFNIICGAVVFRWTMNFLKYNGEGHVDRTILGYNQGVYGAIKNFKNKPVTTMQLYQYKGLPFETRCYLLKVLGVFGYMDLIKRNDL